MAGRARDARVQDLSGFLGGRMKRLLGILKSSAPARGSRFSSYGEAGCPRGGLGRRNRRRHSCGRFSDHGQLRSMELRRDIPVLFTLLLLHYTLR